MKTQAQSHEIKSKIYFKVMVSFFLLSLLLLISIPVFAGTVNINKADSAALQQNLDGIGPVKADAIIQYRKKNGPFKSTSDLANVPGIGSEILNNNRKNLSTSRGLVKAETNKNQSKDKRTNKSNENMLSKKSSKKKVNKNKLDKKMAKETKANKDKSSEKVKKVKKVKQSKSKKTNKKLEKVKKSNSKDKVKKSK